MTLADDLLKLDDLQGRGALSADEFAAAKRRLLEGSPVAGDAEAWRTLQRQTALAQLDSEWMVEREQYLVRGRGGPHVPTRDGGLVVRGWAWVFLGALGLLMVATFSFPPGATFSSPPGVLLFYALLIAFGAYEIRHGYRKAERYEAALAVYQRRRQALVDQAGPGNTA